MLCSWFVLCLCFCREKEEVGTKKKQEELLIHENKFIFPMFFLFKNFPRGRRNFDYEYYYFLFGLLVMVIMEAIPYI